MIPTKVALKTTLLSFKIGVHEQLAGPIPAARFASHLRPQRRLGVSFDTANLNVPIQITFRSDEWLKFGGSLLGITVER